MTEPGRGLRAASAADIFALAEIYRSAVAAAAGDHYGPAQRAVWAAYADNPAFAAEVLDGVCAVVETAGRVVAFAQMFPLGHVRLLYTHPDHMRRGYAGLLLTHLERVAEAAGCLHLDTDASHVSRPVFERAGWRVIERQVAVRDGIEFERFRMLKTVASAGGL